MKVRAARVYRLFSPNDRRPNKTRNLSDIKSFLFAPGNYLLAVATGLLIPDNFTWLYVNLKHFYHTVFVNHTNYLFT